MWEPPADDVLPNAKRLAARVAHTVGSFGPASPPTQTVTELLAAVPVSATLDRPLLEAAITALRGDARTSTASVRYAQLGGLTSDATSVMVITEQQLVRGDGTEANISRTLDIRLRLVDGAWAFHELASIGGDPPEAGVTPQGSVTALIDDPRIRLPDSARWDLLRGVDSRLVELLREAADVASFDVAVVASGHPPNVFGTGRISNHTQGRGVDIWAVDGQPVVTQRSPGSPAHRLTVWMFDRGVPELGSPWALGRGSFTNTVHQDHIHAAYHGG